MTPQATTVERIEQRIIHVDRGSKPKMLSDILQQRERSTACWCSPAPSTAPTRWCAACNKDGISAEAIHGNKSQNQRERVLEDFRDGRVRTLVATDIAARGIDVDGISHVINFDLPNIPESYVHRIGRTARAGADGIAISLCSHDELPFLRDIEKLIRMAIPATGTGLAAAPGRTAAAAARRPQRQRPRPRPAAQRPSAATAHRNERGGQRNGQKRSHERNDQHAAAATARPASGPAQQRQSGPPPDRLDPAGRRRFCQSFVHAAALDALNCSLRKDHPWRKKNCSNSKAR